MTKRFSAFVVSCILALTLLFPFKIVTYANDGFVTEADIVIKPAFFEGLANSNNRKEEYPALVSVDGSEYRLVSVNTRGNSSFWDGIFSRSNRMPFEIRFDAYTDTDIGTVRKLKLNNNSSLYRLLCEYTAYKIYEHMGIPTPFVKPVFLSFNSVDFGLYLGVEDISEDFIARHFGKEALETGTLYRSVTEDSLFSSDEYILSDWFGALYIKYGDNHENLFSLTEALSEGEGYEEFLDVDQLIRYFACIACTCDFDSLAGCNNFYMFSHNGKITFIPWDPSQAFHGFNNQDGIFDMSTLFNMVIEDGNNREKYISYIEHIRETFLSPDISAEYVKGLVSSLESYCRRDSSIEIPVDIMLDNITDGNILIDGNFALALSEAYRQLGEQLRGEKTAFYVPDSMTKNLREAYPPEELYIDGLESVVKEIKQSFSSQFYYQTILQPERMIFLAVLTVPVIALLFYLFFTTFKQKKSARKHKSIGEIN